MKIYLFYQDQIYNFLLPKEISGSYSFDANKNETSKLVNIEAREGKWVIYSTDGVNLVYDRRFTRELLLTLNTFYIVNRENKNYLVYVTDVESSKFTPYTYGNGFSMTISNNSGTNVLYSCPFLNGIIKIYKHENNYLLEQTNAGTAYINNKIVSDNQGIVKIGDKITIFSLEIIILKNMIFINNPGNTVRIPNLDFGLLPYQDNDEEPKNIVIQDKELYDKKDYYSKSPRIRRVIETKKVKLSPPPSNNDDEELPFILTVGPMATMGIMSVVMLVNTLMRVSSGEATMAQSWPQLVTASAMLLSMLMWPAIIRIYNKKQKERKRQELIEKYDKYLAEKEKEVIEEAHLQKDILLENLITLNNCAEIISRKGVGFWDKRVDQSDFLVVRLGIGNEPLDLELEYPDQEFTIDEDELRKRADAMVERHKYISNVPVSYSFYDNKITAIMGDNVRSSHAFMDNLLLQLLTFYSYEDLKLVIFTNEESAEYWEYVRYLNHAFDNERRFRFFATDVDSTKAVCEYLDAVLNQRLNDKDDEPRKPHYLVISDDYDLVKRFDFMKNLTEAEDDANTGFSLVVIEERLNKLPSKCNNFISIVNGKTAVLKNSYEKQEQIPFVSEINYDVNMMNVSKIMSNIPIEFEEGVSALPDAISFLEMHKVGKVEQLNVLNRWNTSDPTMTLRAEVGVDNQGDVMYLDLHEKQHGPHGLIAGTTGSGKSEFIITYILSMCINYSPDDVSFILIDYKGGGLALAFENRTAGIVLPHLAGTITNLDKAEMDRTLVSIESENKRRQEMFNKARDELGESTMDIYKYQRLYKEGRVKEPIPHLFIICDEFAELKQQQPDFMDSLVSTARIGRSLGVHLILATQKPSGIVTDQIWSNSRFKVCLKVQDEADSKEMLKKPDAAYIKNAGRYYLMVGYDEYFASGQSGYTGAKYFPSDKIVKEVDKSINFINDFGQPIKGIQASTGPKTEAQGDQIKAVMDLIISLARQSGKQSRQLWLPNIPETILIDDIEKKYNLTPEKFNPKVIIGEYDAPEKQEQGKVVYDLLENGNTAIYGNDGAEREMLLSAIIYGLAKNHTAEEVNIYTIDYGSESLRRFQTLPQVGGMVFQGDDEKYNNLLKMLKEEMANRKKLFVDYGGEYKSYIKNSPNKLPLIVVIVNNFDSINETDTYAYIQYAELLRDSERYGIIYMITGDGVTSINHKLSQNLHNIYSYKLKDHYDYPMVFNAKVKITLREVFGRGFLNNDGVHEFQTAKICDNEDKINEFIQAFIRNQIQCNKMKSKKIPTLPAIVGYDEISKDIDNLTNVPIGISKHELEIITVDLLNNSGVIISSNRILNTIIFVKSLLILIKNIKNTNLIIFDSKAELELSNDIFPNYFTKDMEDTSGKIIDYLTKLKQASNDVNTIILIYNLSKYCDSMTDKSKLNDLLDLIKIMDTVNIIAVDDAVKLKNVQFEEWFRASFNANDGIWIGKGVGEQSFFHVNNIIKEMFDDIKNDMGYYVSENRGYLCKMIDFISQKGDDENEK